VQVKTVHSICFSPTGTTRTVLEGIASGLGLGLAGQWDLTLPGYESPDLSGQDAPLALIGAPVYAGRVPETAVTRLREIDGQGVPAVVVVTYGNRHYDDALVELFDLAGEQGFVPVAAGAFIGEHSFSSAAMPVAQGRPDIEDIDKATRFGQSVAEKLAKADAKSLAEGLKVPGNRPYKEGWSQPPMAPSVSVEDCNLCGTCVDVCPTGAISVAEEASTDATKCIMCAACVRACPVGARVMDVPLIQGLNKKLYENFSERREPELFV